MVSTQQHEPSGKHPLEILSRKVQVQVHVYVQVKGGMDRCALLCKRKSYTQRKDEQMSNNTQKLAGKVAVVTGASKGIGASIAKNLAAEGASVVVNYASSKAGADKVVGEIAAQGGKAIAVQADVAKKADIERLFAETKKTFGHVDVLVNNAGVYEFLPIEQITEEHFHKQFNLNVLGLILATQEAVKQFGFGGGSVINISSAVSTTAPAGGSVYSATKGAVDTLTKSLAKELGSSKIRVNAINPGMIETEGLHSTGFLGSEFQSQLEAQTPLGGIGQPQDIAKVAVFLASADSGWITGETLLVSGGYR
jgi:3-oxoacyl-[acyl-carrier protein] reductase